MDGLPSQIETGSFRLPLDPLFWGAPLIFRKKFKPLGATVCIASNSEKVLEAAEESFGFYGTVENSAAVDFTLNLCVDPLHRQKSPFPPASFRALGHLFHISCGNSSFAVADLESGSAIGFVAAEIVQDRSFFRNTFLECLFYVLAVHFRFTPVHAAGVVFNQQGILIWGEPGAGKSTLAYACARAGFQLVSDDVVHLEIDPASNQLMGWGRPWQIRLLPDAKTLFPELGQEEPRLRSDHQWYLEIDLAKRMPESLLVSCRPSILLFLRRGPNAGSRIESLDSEQALNLMKKDIYLTEQSVLQRHYLTLQHLVHSKIYRLYYEGPPVEAVALIKNLVL